LRSAARPDLLWMRTFHEIYNPLLAVEAFRQVKQAYPSARLTMAGQEKGSLGTVQQRVHAAGLDDSVRFVGFLQMDDKKRQFAGHDVFLSTNRVDNMPVSVIEAAAFGMPIVATAVGGVPCLLQDGETGLLVPDEDANAMAGAIRRVLEEPGLAERLSGKARKLGEQHDWSVVLPQWESLFHELMELQA
jgi:L-malate glycosyltransferase